MRLSFCPSCRRVYAVADDGYYLCARKHVTTVWADGAKRRYVVSERTESDQPPWPIPFLVEESEMIQVDFVESWLNECKYPDDKVFSDRRRHFGYATIGGRHLTTDEMLAKYHEYVLQAVYQVPTQIPARE